MKKTMKLKQYDFKVLIGPGNVNEGYYAMIGVLACNKKEACAKAKEKCKEYNLTICK